MRFVLDIYKMIRMTDRRTDLDIMITDKEDGQALSKFRPISVAFLVEKDGSVTLLTNATVKVKPFGTPDSD